MGLPVRCPLGEIQVTHHELLDGRQRQYLWTSFDPSFRGLTLLSEVAEGVEGVEGVARSFQDGSTVVLILRNGVKPAETARRFARAVASRLREMHDDELRSLTGGLILPKTALAVNSTGGIWNRSEHE